MALALATSTSPSEIEPLRCLARPRPYSDEVNLRIDLEGGVKIGDRVLGLPALQIEKPAAVERIDEVRAQPKRFVAVLQRRLQVADHGACPAAIIVSFDVLRVQPERVVEIVDGEVIGALAGIDLAAPV